MGATYTRQSSAGITDGAVIEASDINDEFDQLLAAFVAASGHTHDGTAAEGGPVAKLLGTSITIGDGTAGTDITVTFDGETSDGVLTWMEDEDHFKFSDDIVVDSTKKLYFYDEGGEYISGDGTDLTLTSGADINIPSSIGLTFGNDGEKIEGDGTDLTITGNTINLTATTDVALAANTGLLLAGTEKIESDGTDLSITVGAGGDINIGSDIGLTFGNDGEKIEGDGTDLTIASSGVLNLAAGGSTNQVKVTDGAILPITDNDVDLGSSTYEFKNAYFDGTLEADAITVGGTSVLTGGADTALTSITNTSLTIGRDADNDIDFATDNNILFRASGADQIKLIDGVLAPVADDDIDLGSSSLQFKNAYIDGTLEADAITIGGTAIGSIYGVIAGSSSIVTTGALDSGSITSGFGAIDNGTSNIRSATITAETAFVPDASGGADLGTTALEFNDAFFNDSAVINFGDAQDITLTHTANTGLTLAGSHANGTNLQLNNTAADGDPAIQFALSGTVAYTMGVEDGDSDKFVINYGTGALGAQPALEITSAGAVTVPGDLTVSGTLTGAASAGFALAMAVAL